MVALTIVNLILVTFWSNFIKSFQSVVISPYKDVEFGSSLVANEQLIRFRMAHGTKMAQNVFEKKDMNHG
jgi:hypothetical protein